MIDVKNAILITVVLVIAGYVGFYLPYVRYREAQKDTVPVVVGDGPVTRVFYTNRGFEPETVTVEQGTTVEWVNESDKLMWVASDDHPSHTKLRGFDQKGSEGNVEPALPQSLVPIAYAHDGVEIYRYTFMEKGTWEYHNHLVPADTGTVIVE